MKERREIVDDLVEREMKVKVKGNRETRSPSALFERIKSNSFNLIIS